MDNEIQYNEETCITQVQLQTLPRGPSQNPGTMCTIYWSAFCSNLKYTSIKLKFQCQDIYLADLNRIYASLDEKVLARDAIVVSNSVGIINTMLRHQACPYDFNEDSKVFSFVEECLLLNERAPSM